MRSDLHNVTPGPLKLYQGTGEKHTTSIKEQGLLPLPCYVAPDVLKILPEVRF